MHVMQVVSLNALLRKTNIIDTNKRSNNDSDCGVDNERPVVVRERSRRHEYAQLRAASCGTCNDGHFPLLFNLSSWTSCPANNCLNQTNKAFQFPLVRSASTVVLTHAGQRRRQQRRLGQRPPSPNTLSWRSETGSAARNANAC